MGIFSGMMANGWVPGLGRLATGMAAGTSPAPPGSGRRGSASAGALVAGVDPRRLALIQAMLAGRDRAVSRVTDPLRRERPASGAQADDVFVGDQMADAGQLPPEGAEAPLWPGIRHPTGHVPEGLRGPRIPLDSDFINRSAARPQPGPGSWQFDTLEQLEAAFDDMAPREELVEIARRGGVLNERWLGDLDNALRRRDGDPEAAIPFRNFIPDSQTEGPTIIRESETVRGNRRQYREALRRKGLNGFGYIPRPGKQDVYDLARIMYAEALNAPEDMPAVGWTVVNRTGRPGYRSTITDVIHQPRQFEPVREGNRSGRDSVNWTRFATPELLTRDERKLRMRAFEHANAILSGREPDMTGGATHFQTPTSGSAWFASSLGRKIDLLPYRSKSTNPNRHLFYRERGPRVRK